MYGVAVRNHFTKASVFWALVLAMLRVLLRSRRIVEAMGAGG
jgi:hypothetical protein